MSNIERKYAYHDDGVLPSVGEYGVTYLTLYSSEAGNIYDGWIYDPDNKTPLSETPRTFGYRNPNYTQYCWDDEVIVDLSNAQSRQESSEFSQGRIVAFNTSVSDQPIVLQDIDVTGLTEEQREAKATTILFTAIPLVDDSYIQAQVEVQMKCNISENNTSGEMRVEAFYILNDESDRTMRPNPIHTFSVTSANERHTLPWLYFNPALNHDTNNYIGVKLIASGGTAEIGISDVREYGDAIITLTSAGLTGDRIYDAKPVRIWIEGETLVPLGYKIDISDYDVFCEYDDGSEYIVTHFCKITPEEGTPMMENFLLQAEYMGMHATLRVMIAPVERIELTGVDYFFSTLTLKLEDYNVIGYLTNGDVWDVTDLCEYSPAMGTTIRQDTTLTATFTNPGPLPVSDSLLIEKDDTAIITADNGGGLVYTLYADARNTVEITGNANGGSQYSPEHERIKLPTDIVDRMYRDNIGPYVLKWNAEGTPGGLYLDNYDYSAKPLVTLCQRLENFEDVHFAKEDINNHQYIMFCFYKQRLLTSTNLMCLSNIEDDCPIRLQYEAFSGCEELTNVDFVSDWNISLDEAEGLFRNCINLINIEGLRSWDITQVRNGSLNLMFYGCEKLASLKGLEDWDVSNVKSMTQMFNGCTLLEHADPLWFWEPLVLEKLSGMFLHSGIESCDFFTNWNKTTWKDCDSVVSYCPNLRNLRGLEGINFTEEAGYIGYGYVTGYSGITSLLGSEDWICGDKAPTFINCENLVDIEAAEFWDMTHTTSIQNIFKGCSALSDIRPLRAWNTSRITSMANAFFGCSELVDLQPLSDWDTGAVRSMAYMFAWCNKARYIGCLSGWDVHSVEGRGVDYMFARGSASDWEQEPEYYIYDADSLNWNVPIYEYTDPRYYRCDPPWQCLWFTNSYATTADSTRMFKGTSYPDASYPNTHQVNLSRKEHPLPYWYYHNDRYINELL